MSMTDPPLTHCRAASPAEKDEILERLRQLWQANPRLRLMQLIENAFRTRGSAYALEDYDAIALLEAAYLPQSQPPSLVTAERLVLLPDHEVTVMTSLQDRNLLLQMYCPPPCGWECVIAGEDGTPKTYTSLREMAKLAAECHSQG